MAQAEKRSFSLPAEQVGYIDALVASGTYATASEVIRAGLRALQERDAAVERWLREEVAPTFDATLAAPERSVPASSVFDDLRVRHARRSRAGEG